MNQLVKLTIIVEDDGSTHTEVICGPNKSFMEVLNGLNICHEEIEKQITDRFKCPYSQN
jgi:hypothetical protein